MTDAGPGVSAEEHRALWLEVLRWPLKGGMLGGTILLTALAFASAQCEGGYSQSAQEQRGMAQGVVILASLAVLGHYAWRTIACTFPAERTVPWGADPNEETPLLQRISAFLVAVAVAFLPGFAVMWIAQMIGAPGWLVWIVLFAGAALGAAVLPLGLAGAVAGGGAFAALPGPVNRMRKAQPDAARIAAMASAVFVGLLVLSAWMAATFVKHPLDIGLPGDHSKGDPDTVGSLLRTTLFLLRAGGFYAALVSFRVAGLLVREVPEIRKVLG